MVLMGAEGDDGATEDQDQKCLDHIQGDSQAGTDDHASSRDPFSNDEEGMEDFPGQVWQEFIRERYRLVTGPEALPAGGDGDLAVGSRQRLLIRRGLGVCIGMHSGLDPSSPCREGAMGQGDSPSLHGASPSSPTRGDACPPAPTASRMHGALGFFRRNMDKRGFNTRFQGDILTSAQAISHACYPGQVRPTRRFEILQARCALPCCMLFTPLAQTPQVLMSSTTFMQLRLRTDKPSCCVVALHMVGIEYFVPPDNVVSLSEHFHTAVFRLSCREITCCQVS